MALSAYAVLNPLVISQDVSALKSNIVFPWEVIEHPDLGSTENISPIVVDLQADNVEAIERFASAFSDLPWGFGILIDSQRTLRQIRQSLRRLANIIDSAGHSREWFWYDPRFLKVVITHITDPASAEVFFAESQTYVTVLKEDVLCFQWNGTKVMVIER